MAAAHHHSHCYVRSRDLPVIDEEEASSSLEENDVDSSSLAFTLDGIGLDNVDDDECSFGVGSYSSAGSYNYPAAAAGSDNEKQKKTNAKKTIINSSYEDATSSVNHIGKQRLWETRFRQEKSDDASCLGAEEHGHATTSSSLRSISGYSDERTDRINVSSYSSSLCHGSGSSGTKTTETETEEKTRHRWQAWPMEEIDKKQEMYNISLDETVDKVSNQSSNLHLNSIDENFDDEEKNMWTFDLSKASNNWRSNIDNDRMAVRKSKISFSTSRLITLAKIVEVTSAYASTMKDAAVVFSKKCKRMISESKRKFITREDDVLGAGVSISNNSSSVNGENSIVTLQKQTTKRQGVRYHMEKIRQEWWNSVMSWWKGANPLLKLAVCAALLFITILFIIVVVALVERSKEKILSSTNDSAQVGSGSANMISVGSLSSVSGSINTTAANSVVGPDELKSKNTSSSLNNPASLTSTDNETSIKNVTLNTSGVHESSQLSSPYLSFLPTLSPSDSSLNSGMTSKESCVDEKGRFLTREGKKHSCSWLNPKRISECGGDGNEASELGLNCRFSCREYNGCLELLEEENSSHNKTEEDFNFGGKKKEEMGFVVTGPPIMTPPKSPLDQIIDEINQLGDRNSTTKEEEVNATDHTYVESCVDEVGRFRTRRGVKRTCSWITATRTLECGDNGKEASELGIHCRYSCREFNGCFKSDEKGKKHPNHNNNKKQNGSNSIEPLGALELVSTDSSTIAPTSTVSTGNLINENSSGIRGKDDKATTKGVGENGNNYFIDVKGKQQSCSWLDVRNFNQRSSRREDNCNDASVQLICPSSCTDYMVPVNQRKNNGDGEDFKHVNSAIASQPQSSLSFKHDLVPQDDCYDHDGYFLNEESQPKKCSWLTESTLDRLDVMARKENNCGLNGENSVAPTDLGIMCKHSCGTCN